MSEVLPCNLHATQTALSRLSVLTAEPDEWVWLTRFPMSRDGFKALVVWCLAERLYVYSPCWRRVTLKNIDDWVEWGVSVSRVKADSDT